MPRGIAADAPAHGAVAHQAARASQGRGPRRVREAPGLDRALEKTAESLREADAGCRPIRRRQRSPDAKSIERYKIDTFSPSTKPASLRPCWNPRSWSSSAAWVRNPITGIADCCARAASGHAAPPPRRLMNSRRRISAPKLRGQHCIGSSEYIDRAQTTHQNPLPQCTANVADGSKARITAVQQQWPVSPQ